MSLDENHVRSPCTRVCVIDPLSGYCRGCLRTLDEIVGWGVASPDQRRAILAALEERR
ncbi:DUF1289 domain-containing protein [Skermanella stibiiresistens]|uniref:DUF1289 domain-containing protein n=1 Tax=Skermanella stibiiresistens TaxID=913326 RepID=UPI000A05F100|nr:DUF1289 domain-containing protein [Skermanella stibiiresistens]